VSVPVDPIGIASALDPVYGEGQLQRLSFDTLGRLRTVSRPHPHLGRYRIGGTTGKYAGLAANAELFQMRWSDRTLLCLIWQVSVSVAMDVAPTAAGQVDRQLVIARRWTANGSGGTAVTLNTGAGRLRGNYPPSLVADMRFTSNAALGTGTKTNDGIGVGIASGTAETGALTTSSTGIVIPKCDLFNAQAGPHGHPIVLQQNEGIVVLMPTAQPATMSLQTYVDVEWSEAIAY
jgi:hypothetical protein